MAYCCPQCKFQWNRKDFYKVKNGTIKKTEKVVDISAEYKYPIIKDDYINEFTKIHHWREILYCPNCLVEVEYDMNAIIAEEIINEQRNSRKAKNNVN